MTRRVLEKLLFLWSYMTGRLPEFAVFPLEKSPEKQPIKKSPMRALGFDLLELRSWWPGGILAP